MSERTLSILNAMDKINDWLETFKPVESEGKFYYKIHRREVVEKPYAIIEWYLDIDFDKRDFKVLKEYWASIGNNKLTLRKTENYSLKTTDFEKQHLNEEDDAEFFNKAEYLVLHWDWYRNRILKEYNGSVDTVACLKEFVA